VGSVKNAERLNFFRCRPSSAQGDVCLARGEEVFVQVNRGMFDSGALNPVNREGEGESQWKLTSLPFAGVVVGEILAHTRNVLHDAMVECHLYEGRVKLPHGACPGPRLRAPARRWYSGSRW